MGAFVSSMLGSGPAQSPPPLPPKVVLVPPFFQRDIRGLSRFCRSSYDYLGNRKQLARLLRDHLSPEMRGMLLLSPPDDPRVSVRAKMRKSGGSMVLRWQPASAASVHTFIEMAASLDSPGDVALRGSYLHPGIGLGAFLVAPLAGDLSGKSAQVGVRYSSTSATAGAVLVPRRGELATLWLAGRLYGLTLGFQLSPRLPVRPALSTLTEGSLTGLVACLGAKGGEGIGSSSSSSSNSNIAGAGGVQPPDAAVQSKYSSSNSNSTVGRRTTTTDLRSWFRSHASVLLAYSPPPRAGAAGAPFTAAVELSEGGALTFSFLQHVAATRQVVNPFEEDEVVGITNYLDIGLQLTTAVGPSVSSISSSSNVRPASADSTELRCNPSATSTAVSTSSEPARPAAIDMSVSWQINKNWLVKARVGNQSAAAAVGARVWHAVSAYLTASVAVDFAHMTHPRYGVELCVENIGPLRYERGSDDVVAGRALLQRHEASKQDLDNFEGRGALIRRSEHDGGDGSWEFRTSGGRHLTEADRWKVAELM